MRFLKQLPQIAVPIAVVLTSTVSGGYAHSLRDGISFSVVPSCLFSVTQSVDSRGCVFARASSGGMVSWVPRVSRSGELLCGYRPTTVGALQRTAVGVTTKSGREQQRLTKATAYAEVVQSSPGALKMPQGYEKAHKDGRDNPKRGLGTVIGKSQMALVWSDTVPRYLIDPATGKRAK